MGSTTPKRPEYPVGVPNKFTPEGFVQRFAGNTTVCHIPRSSPLLPTLEKVHATFTSHPLFSKRIHLLPKASWHMTVFDGVREAERDPELWPAKYRSLEDCTRDFAAKLRRLGLTLEGKGLAPPYRMRARGFDPALAGIGLEVEGATVEEEQRMRRLRDEIAGALGFRAPNHEEYVFHVSIAYLLRHVDGEERERLNDVLGELIPVVKGVEFELGAVEFNTFEDMHSYPRVFYLGEEEIDGSA